jgi:hypothetical protein
MYFKHSNLLLIILSTFAMTFATASMAETKIEAAKRCLGDNTTGKDRKELAKWIFMMLGAHPEISTVVTISPDLKEKSNQAAGLLFSTLIAEKCNVEIRELIAESGNSAIEVPFRFLGELATKELMTDPNVTASMTGFTRYIDQDKLNKALGAK